MSKLTLARLGLLGLLAAATPAVAQSVGEKSGVNAVLGIAPSTPDFVREATLCNMFEVGSGEVAEGKSDGATKAFAARMVAEHGRVSTALAELVQSGAVKADVPAQLDSTRQARLDKLKSLTGDEFVKQYHDDQVGAHEEAVSLFERYAKGGDNDALKAFATMTLPDLKEHLGAARDLDR